MGTDLVIGSQILHVCWSRSATPNTYSGHICIFGKSHVRTFVLETNLVGLAVLHHLAAVAAVAAHTCVHA